MEQKVLTWVEPNDDEVCQKALLCAKFAIEKKGENVQILRLKEKTAFTDYFVIVSGTSSKQLQAIADSIEAVYKPFLAKEGYQEGRWILLDLGGVVVHLFIDALRAYYQLENLWTSVEYLKIPSSFYGFSATRQMHRLPEDFSEN